MKPECFPYGSSFRNRLFSPGIQKPRKRPLGNHFTKRCAVPRIKHHLRPRLPPPESPAKPYGPHRLFRRTAFGPRNTADGNSNIGSGAFQSSFRHRFNHGFADCSVTLQNILRNAQHLRLCPVGISNPSEFKNPGGPRNIRNPLGNQAAGAALRRRRLQTLLRQMAHNRCLQGCPGRSEHIRPGRAQYAPSRPSTWCRESSTSSWRSLSPIPTRRNTRK